MQRPKLRDNKGKEPFELYQLGQIPDNVIYAYKNNRIVFSEYHIGLAGQFPVM